jgi:predicted negative regulator of RcsB-dependent stress response
MKHRQFRKAAQVFFRALEVARLAVDQNKCPTNRVRFKHVEALHAANDNDWVAYILEANELLADKDYGLQARLLLAQAHVENKQADKAIAQLSELQGSTAWNDVALVTMGQALLQTSPPRPTEAIKYIEEAYRKQPGEEKRVLEYAQVLRLLDRSVEARDLYRSILNKNPKSDKAKVGLDELEIVFDKLRQAEQSKAAAEAELQAQKARLQWIQYVGSLILAAGIPLALLLWYYRRQWALRCFHQVCALEADLVQLIRDRVRTRWEDAWDRLGEEPFRGRLDYKALRSKAVKQGVGDILAVANFGHLVGIVDAGWEVLGFKELCAAAVPDPKEVIVAHLSYVSSCRACLAHCAKIEVLTSRRAAADRLIQGTRKAQMPKYLHRQVRTSLKLIRSRFNLRPQVEELPILCPVHHAQASTGGPNEHANS